MTDAEQAAWNEGYKHGAWQARHCAPLAQPVQTGIVGWHIRMRGCDGSADWVDIGPAPGVVPPEADALPLVYAQQVPCAAP
jgi:hypothetical protein